MKILIDADGCPVIDIAVALCQTYDFRCLLVCDTAHALQRSDAETITVDKGADSADYALVNLISRKDIVITQDYGLAAMCLARDALVLHQDGWWYTNENIEALLLARHLSRKARTAGKNFKGPHKRTSSQNIAFHHALDTYLQTIVQG